MALRVDGHRGALRVGYQVAAELSAWTLELLPVAPRRYSFTARVCGLSAYWFDQRPLDLIVDVGHDAWCWRNVEPSIDSTRDGRMQVTVPLTLRPEVLHGWGAAQEEERRHG